MIWTIVPRGGFWALEKLQSQPNAQYIVNRK